MSIKQNQIVQDVPKTVNPNSGLPRDLKQFQVDQSVEPTSESSFSESVSVLPESNNPIVVPPTVPLINSVKSQTVTPKLDGTFSVDVVFDVSGITSEYEVRISRAG